MISIWIMKYEWSHGGIPPNHFTIVYWILQTSFSFFSDVFIIISLFAKFYNENCNGMSSAWKRFPSVSKHSKILKKQQPGNLKEIKISTQMRKGKWNEKKIGNEGEFEALEHQPICQKIVEQIHCEFIPNSQQHDHTPPRWFGLDKVDLCDLRVVHFVRVRWPWQLDHFPSIHDTRDGPCLAFASNKVRATPIDRLVGRSIFDEFRSVHNQRSWSVLWTNEMRNHLVTYLEKRKNNIQFS